MEHILWIVGRVLKMTQNCNLKILFLSNYLDPNLLHSVFLEYIFLVIYLILLTLKNYLFDDIKKV